MSQDCCWGFGLGLWVCKGMLPVDTYALTKPLFVSVEFHRGHRIVTC